MSDVPLDDEVRMGDVPGAGEDAGEGDAARDARPPRDERPLRVLLEAPVSSGPALDHRRGAPSRAGAAPVPSRGGIPSGPLARRYAGPLEIPLHPDRPTIVANFVESLDGVTAAGVGPAAGGSTISGGFEPDRFVMALLRSLADAVVIGAGTLRAAPRHEWTPRGIAAAWAGEHDAWRRELGLAPQPTTVVVTGRGDVPPLHPGLTRPDVPVVIATTRDGASRLAGAGVPAGARVEAVTHGHAVHPRDLLGLLDRLGVRLAVCEGGPRLLGALLDAGAVDELFVTLAPHLLGRAEGAARRGLVEERAWPAGEEPWARLQSVRASESHLFLRYAVEGRREQRSPS